MSAADLCREMTTALPAWARSAQWLGAGYRGSHAHGTTIPSEDEHGTDDTDVFLVTLQTKDFYASLRPTGRECFETAGADLDILVYDARKFFGLLMAQNPNSHAWLWTAPFYFTPGWNRIVELRKSLLSRVMFKHLVGYAEGQRAMMRRLGTKGRYAGAKRAALMQRYGYDIKNAAHCLRLVYLGQRLAITGDLEVWLPQEMTETLVSVKRGQQSFQWVERTFANEIAKFRDLEAQSFLPATVAPEVFVGLWSSLLADAIAKEVT